MKRFIQTLSMAAALAVPSPALLAEEGLDQNIPADGQFPQSLSSETATPPATALPDDNPVLPDGTILRNGSGFRTPMSPREMFSLDGLNKMAPFSGGAAAPFSSGEQSSNLSLNPLMNSAPGLSDSLPSTSEDEAGRYGDFSD